MVVAGFLLLLAGGMVVATFFVFTVSLGISERIHRFQAGRRGFDAWLERDRQLDDGGVLLALQSRPAVDRSLTTSGAIAIVEAGGLADPDLRAPLATELAHDHVRLRVWAHPTDPHRADLVVVQTTDGVPDRLEPIGTPGWIDLARRTRRLPVVHARPRLPGLVVTDADSLERLGADGLDRVRPSWPGPPDDERITVPIVDGRGAWVQAHGIAGTFVIRDAADRVVGVGAAFGQLGRPTWQPNRTSPDQNSST